MSESQFYVSVMLNHIVALRIIFKLRIYSAGEEDWRGKNSNASSGKRRSKYSMLNKSMPITKQIPKLSNRHRKKYNKRLTVETYNECSFDSLFQIYAALYMDYDRIKLQIDRIDDSDFCNMIQQACKENRKSLANLNDLYIIRDTIMQNVVSNDLNTVRTESGLISIDCNSNIDYIIEHVLPQKLCSYLRTKSCELCGAKIESNRYFIDLNLEKFAKKNTTIKHLEKLLRHEMMSEEISSKCTNQLCDAIFKIQTTFFDVVMIDVQMLSRRNNKRFSINEAPMELELCGKKFKIVALIEFISDDDCLQIEGAEVIGHYVSHIKRINSVWEKYDDCVSKIQNSDCKRKMEVHTLFYIKDSF